MEGQAPQVRVVVGGMDEHPSRVRIHRRAVHRGAHAVQMGPVGGDGGLPPRLEVLLELAVLALGDGDIWVGGFGPRTIDETARRGYNLGSGVAEPFMAALQAHGRDPAQHHCCDLRWIHVAPTRQQAWDEAEEGLHHVLHFYRTWTNQPGTDANGPLAELPPLGQFRATQGIGMVFPFLVGTPDDIAEHFETYRHRPVSHCALEFNHAGMDVDSVRRSMQLFAREIIPAFR